MKYIDDNGYAAIEVADSVYTFEITGQDRSELVDQIEQSKLERNYEDYPFRVNQYKVFPNGSSNNVPKEIRELLKANHLAPRIFKKKKYLLWGRGPILKKLEPNDDGTIKESYILNDPEITPWLKSFNYRKYLLQAIEDFGKLEYQASKVFRSRAARIGRADFIAKIEHVPGAKVRLGCLASDQEDIPTHVLVGNWHGLHHKDLQVYKLSDEMNLAKYPVSVHFSSLYTMAYSHYPYPDVMSVKPWMKRSSAIPYILETFTKNNLTIRWHIKSPQAYWDAVEQRLQDECREKNITYKHKMLEKAKEDKFKQIAKVFSSAENTGKFITTETIKEVLLDRHVVDHQWQFDPIDQKVKEFIDAQLKISERADLNTNAGLGLHQALSNVSTTGKSDSGSEQLYASRNHNMSEVDIPEMIICDTINKAIEINWPGKDVRLGFYRDQPVREQDVTPSKRVKDDSAVQ